MCWRQSQGDGYRRDRPCARQSYSGNRVFHPHGGALPEVLKGKGASRSSGIDAAPQSWRRAAQGVYAMSQPTSIDLKELKRRMHGALDVLKHEFAGLRTGRASASLLEPITIEAYGSTMPLNQVGTISRAGIADAARSRSGTAASPARSTRPSAIPISGSTRSPRVSCPRADSGAIDRPPPGTHQGCPPICREGPGGGPQCAARRHGSAEAAGEAMAISARTSIIRRMMRSRR